MKLHPDAPEMTWQEARVIVGIIESMAAMGRAAEAAYDSRYMGPPTRVRPYVVGGACMPYDLHVRVFWASDAAGRFPACEVSCDEKDVAQGYVDSLLAEPRASSVSVLANRIKDARSSIEDAGRLDMFFVDVDQ